MTIYLQTIPNKTFKINVYNEFQGSMCFYQSLKVLSVSAEESNKSENQNIDRFDSWPCIYYWF